MTPTEAYNDGCQTALKGGFRASPGLNALNPEYDKWYEGYDSVTASNRNPSLTSTFRLRRGVETCRRHHR